MNAEWQSSPDWRLTGGLRYTDEDKDFSNTFSAARQIESSPENVSEQ